MKKSEAGLGVAVAVGAAGVSAVAVFAAAGLVVAALCPVIGIAAGVYLGLTVSSASLGALGAGIAATFGAATPLVLGAAGAGIGYVFGKHIAAPVVAIGVVALTGAGAAASVAAGAAAGTATIVAAGVAQMGISALKFAAKILDQTVKIETAALKSAGAHLSKPSFSGITAYRPFKITHVKPSFDAATAVSVNDNVAKPALTPKPARHFGIF